MMKKTALAALVLLVGISATYPPERISEGPIAAPVVKTEVEPLARFVPRELDMYVSVRNADHFLSSLRDGELGAPLRSMGLGDLLDELLPMSSGQRAEIAFAVEMPDGELVPRIYMLMQIDGANFDDQIGNLVEEAFADVEQFGLTYDVEEFEAFTVYTFIAVGIELGTVLAAGDRMAIAIGTDSDVIVDLFDENDTKNSFAGTGAFKALHKAAAEGDAEVMSYMRAEPIFDLIQTALAAEQLLGDPGTLETIFMWLMELPGLDMVEGAGVSLSLDENEEVDGAFTVQFRN